MHVAWLSAAGHRVELLDPVPSHVATARGLGTFGAVVGDARALPWPDDTFDAALLLGPLYHLESAGDRRRALAEAVRVTRPGGRVFAAAIPRMVAFAAATLGQPPAAPLPEPHRELLEEGRFTFTHIRFPGAHFHTGEELEEEVATVGLTAVRVVGLEGPAGPALEVRGTDDDNLFEAALAIARQLGELPEVRDLSNHMLALGTVPGDQG